MRRKLQHNRIYGICYFLYYLRIESGNLFIYLILESFCSEVLLNQKILYVLWFLFVFWNFLWHFLLLRLVKKCFELLIKLLLIFSTSILNTEQYFSQLAVLTAIILVLSGLMYKGFLSKLWNGLDNQLYDFSLFLIIRPSYWQLYCNCSLQFCL